MATGLSWWVISVIAGLHHGAILTGSATAIFQEARGIEVFLLCPPQQIAWPVVGGVLVNVHTNALILRLLAVERFAH